MTAEAREIARKMLLGQDKQPDELIIGGESFVTDPIDPPKGYSKETKEAWNNLMALYVEHGALNKRMLPQFRMMFDNLDYYHKASETIESITAGKAGQGRPADIYGGLKETIAARDTFARNYQEFAKIFNEKPFKPITDEDIWEMAIDDAQWRLFVIEHDAEAWEEYKKLYCEQNDIDPGYFDSMEFIEDRRGY